MRAGRPLRPSLSGWRLGLASLIVFLTPIIVVTLLLTEFNVLQEAADADLSAASDAVSQSTLVLEQSETPLVALQTDATPEADAAAEGEGEQTYIVVPGDTLASIARRFGSDVFAMAAYNDLADINRLDVGQQLRIPPPGYETPPPDPEDDADRAAGPE